MPTFTVIQTVPIDSIADVLCSAVDPGYEAIAYWGEVRYNIPPKHWTYEQRPVYKTEEEANANTNVHYRHYYPLNKGGALIIQDNEADTEKCYTLDLEAVKRGLQVMAEKYPKHFADIMSDNNDNDTADCLVQCALFGDVIYG